MLAEININQYASIELTEAGLKKVIDILMLLYPENAIYYVNKRIVGNVYTDQLWCIMSDLHEIFFNGSQYLENTTIKIQNL